MEKYLETKLDLTEIFQKLNKNEKYVSFLKNLGNQKERGWEINSLAFNPSKTFFLQDSSQKSLNNLKTFVQENEKENLLIGFVNYSLGNKLLQIKEKTLDDLKMPIAKIYCYSNFLIEKNGKIKAVFKDKKYLKTVKSILNRKVFIKQELSNNKNILDSFKSSTSKKEYSSAYNKIKNYIIEGDIYQINLTHRLEGKTEKDSKTLFLNLLKTNPVDHLAYIENEDFQILSASPERFITIDQNKKISTNPIKGTRPRFLNDNKKDEKMKKELINSEKEAAELNMITDLLRNDIGKIAKAGSVTVEKHREILKCPTVWHTYSKISGQLKDISKIEALLSMLSGGSITGCPKKRAMEIIEELEKYSRGVYTGIIFQIYENKLDSSIAIRTLIKRLEKVYLQVGGGIVYDSKEESEYEETINKAKSFTKIL